MGTPLDLDSDADEALRRYWDADAATYDLWPEHQPRSAAERAAWRATLSALLPAPPARLLDAGAGTGYLSLAAARLGHRVTALDVSGAMLERLRAAAVADALAIEAVCAPADQPPEGPFDAVMERLALWTLPDPLGALAAWRERTVPGGRLLVFEAVWTGGSYAEALRRRARGLLGRLRSRTPEHHGMYPPELISSLPLLRTPDIEHILAAVEAAGWRAPRLVRLRDVEFARVSALPRLEQLLGCTPEYVILADAG